MTVVRVVVSMSGLDVNLRAFAMKVCLEMKVRRPLSVSVCAQTHSIALVYSSSPSQNDLVEPNLKYTECATLDGLTNYQNIVMKYEAPSRLRHT